MMRIEADENDTALLRRLPALPCWVAVCAARFEWTSAAGIGVELPAVPSGVGGILSVLDRFLVSRARIGADLIAAHREQAERLQRNLP